MGKIFALLIILTATQATAEPVRRVLYNGVAMTVNWADDDTHLEVVYPDPLPAELVGQGIPAGALLLEGTWNRNLELLEGQAFSYFEGCAPRAYAVRGVVERGGSLVVLGPAPENCTSGLGWASGAVMRLAPMVQVEPAPQKSSRRERRREREQPEVKRRERPRQERQVRRREPRQQYQQPYQQPYSTYQFRWW